MGIGEYLIIIGLLAGYAKYQFDLSEKNDKRLDKLEHEILSIKHTVENYHSASFYNLENIESRLNMMLSSQEAFMDKVVCRYEKIEDLKHSKDK
jgi:hypothetical protein